MAIPLLIFFFAVQPFERGFFCDDESIRHPFREDTISILACYFVAVTLTLVMVSRGAARSPRRSVEGLCPVLYACDWF